jgi:trehalose synthase
MNHVFTEDLPIHLTSVEDYGSLIGAEAVESVLACADDRVRVLFVQDSALVNALQRSAAVVVQKSLREGFGLTVTEAVWNGAAVVGSDVGGIRHQIDDGATGFLVNGIEETAERIVQLVQDESLQSRLGENAKESVRKRFLMTRLMEDWLDLINSFEASFPLKAAHSL